jgi:HlyD family secretion protein
MSQMIQQPPDPDEGTLSLPNFNDPSLDDKTNALLPRRPWWRQRRVQLVIAVLLLLALVTGVVLPLIRGAQRTISYQMQAVTQADFTLSVSTTGPIQSSVYNLVFSGSGSISEIDVKVGQTVKKNQVLAKLDPTSLQDAVNQAQAAVLTAQTSMGNAQATLGTTQAQSQASLGTAQTTLSNDQAGLTNTQKQSQASINAAQTTLSNDQTSLTNTQNQAQASINAAQTTLSNDQASLASTQTTAQAQIALALTQENQAIAACTSAPTPTSTPTPTPTPTANCVKLAQEQYNQTVAQANASIAAAQARVTSDQSQLALTQMQTSANVAAAQAKVTSDQSQLAVTQAQVNTNNAAAQAKVTSDQKQLTAAMAQANSNNTSGQGQVNSAQSQLQAALVQLQTAQHNLGNATLRAPHAGVVTVLNGTVGGTPGAPANSTGTTSSGGNTFIQISDLSTLQVQANVNEADTAHLNTGEPAEFTVSAYGNRIFTGTVSAVSAQGQTVSNVVTYPVVVDVNMNSLREANLLPGMTANLTIVVVLRPNALLIPVNAVNFARTATSKVNGIAPLITSGQASSATAQALQMLRSLENANPAILQDSPTAAYLLERPNGQTAFIPVPVVLGLTDDIQYEVLSGVSAGDIIVTGSTSQG